MRTLPTWCSMVLRKQTYRISHHGIGLPRSCLSVCKNTGIITFKSRFKHICTKIFENLKIKKKKCLSQQKLGEEDCYQPSMANIEEYPNTMAKHTFTIGEEINISNKILSLITIFHLQHCSSLFFYFFLCHEILDMSNCYFLF